MQLVAACLESATLILGLLGVIGSVLLRRRRHREAMDLLNQQVSYQNARYRWLQEMTSVTHPLPSLAPAYMMGYPPGQYDLAPESTDLRPLGPMARWAGHA